jgi:TonB family protein
MRQGVLALALLCSGCPSLGIGADCDKDQLIELSAAMEGADPYEQVDVLLLGLDEACGKGFPEAARIVYMPYDASGRSFALSREPDPQLAKIRKKACPAFDEVAPGVADAPYEQRARVIYEGCDFQRYGILTIDEVPTDSSMLTWGMHQWLLDQGLTAEQAKPITLALFAAERRAFSMIHLEPGQILPKAPGIPLEEGVPLSVSLNEIIFSEKKLVQMRDGQVDENEVKNHLIGPLYDALAEEADKAKEMARQRETEWDARVLLVMDAGVPFSTLVDVLYTAGRAEFAAYGFVVSSPAAYDYTMIPISPPKFGGEPSVAPFMSMVVTPHGITMSRGAGSKEPPANVESGDTESITKYAKQFKSEHPKAHRLAISAGPDVAYEDLIAAMAAARGPDCGADPETCLLPEVTILADDAHGYGPIGAPLELRQLGRELPTDLEDLDEDLWGGLTPDELAEAYGVGGLGLGAQGKRPPGEIGDGKPVPRVRQGKATVRGMLDKDIIRRIVRAHINEVRHCYNKGLNKNPDLEGELVVSFEISKAGSVTKSEVKTPVDDAAVGKCVAKAIKRWKFPGGPGIVLVDYPLILVPR